MQKLTVSERISRWARWFEPRWFEPVALLAVGQWAIMGIAFVWVAQAGAGEVGYLDGMGKSVVVWRNADTMHEGQQLYEAKITNWRLFVPLVACVVADGTPVMLTGYESRKHYTPAWDVTVVSGPSIGCRGRISRDDYHPPK